MFTASMFDPASLTKADNGASGLAPGEPGASAAQTYGPRTSSGGLRLDPQVTDVRGGPRPGRPSDAMRLRLATGTAPGEPVTTVAVPAIVKATNGGRTPEDALGYHPGPGTTSGSATPLAESRHARRPGAGRHPQTGQFTRGEGIAAGHASLDQQPHGGAGGPFAAQVADPMTRPVGEVPPGSAIEQCLNEHAASVSARRLDLAGAAGMPDGLAHPVDPTPVSRHSTGLNDLVHARTTAVPADIPGARPDMGWPGPASLADSIAGHQAGPMAFGFQPGNVSLGFKEPQ